MITRADMEKHVQEVENLAIQDPRSYKLRLFGLMFAGYAYLVLAYMLLAALLIGLVTVIMHSTMLWYFAFKLWFLILPLIYLFTKVGLHLLRTVLSFFVSGAIVLKRTDYPDLYKIVDDLQTQLGAPKVSQIHLEADFNAYARVRGPSWLPFGRKNILGLGLPLMELLNLKELESVIAHELGHFSDKQVRFSLMAYSTRLSWLEFSKEINNDKQGAYLLFRPFANFIVPWFEVYAMHLNRQHEYAADKFAAAISKSDFINSQLKLCSYYLVFEHELWPSTFRLVSFQKDPPENFPEQMRAAILNTSAHKLQEYLQFGLEKETDVHDTHPATKHRIQAVCPEWTQERTTPELMPALDTSAAQVLLNSNLETLRKGAGLLWSFQWSKWWKRTYKLYEAGTEYFNELNERWGKEPLTQSEEMAYADAVVYRRVNETDFVKETLEQLVIKYPDNDHLKLRLGEFLLQHDDEAGLAYLEGPVLHSKDAHAACVALVNYYSCRDVEAAMKYTKMSLLASETEQLAGAERRKLVPSISYQPHGLNDDELKAVRQVLIRIEQWGKLEFKKLLLVRRPVEYLSSNPCLVLGFRYKANIDCAGITWVRSTLISELERELPDYTLASWVADFWNSALERSIRKVPDAVLLDGNGPLYARSFITHKLDPGQAT